MTTGIHSPMKDRLVLRATMVDVEASRALSVPGWLPSDAATVPGIGESADLPRRHEKVVHSHPSIGDNGVGLRQGRAAPGRPAGLLAR